MGLYIQMHSVHGLFRGHDLQLGYDEDTGGQIVYVLELAKALGQLKDVDRVDILTRRIIDDEHPGYDEEVEKVTDNVNIVRIECGPKKYIKKVKLWPYIGEYVKNTKKFIKKLGRKPDILQSNYADAGLICAKLSKDLKIPQVHTGHSLGIPKMKRLGVTKSNYKKFDREFHFSSRIPAENKAIHNSYAIVGSTMQEIKGQYKEYEISTGSEKFRTITPGLDLKKFHPIRKSGKDKAKGEDNTLRILENIIRQKFRDPKKRIIGVLTRLEKRKNINGLLEAFGKSSELQKYANLLIFCPTATAGEESQKLVDELSQTIRKHNLYGKVSFPILQLDYDSQVPVFYRFLEKKKGVFANPAFIEPFGLTILEASASKVPVAATRNGGPSEIITEGKDGVLFDPYSAKSISSSILSIMKSGKKHNSVADAAYKNVKSNYTWSASAKKYLKVFNEAISKGANKSE